MIPTLAACGDDESTAASTTEPPSTTSTAVESTTTTTEQDGSTTTSDAGDDDLGPTERCIDPKGFSIAYPASWSVNDGTVTTACSQLDPEPFTVPDATDERVATITAFVDPVPFGDIAGPDDESGLDRAVTVVDGHQAVRLTGSTTGEELYPDGTPVTRYLIDLALGVDDGPGTLFVDIVGVGDVDYDAGSRPAESTCPAIGRT